jgi:hypothetical protein
MDGAAALEQKIPGDRKEKRTQKRGGINRRTTDQGTWVCGKAGISLGRFAKNGVWQLALALSQLQKTKGKLYWQLEATWWV